MADKFKEIGAILAAARQEKKKSLKEAEESTKIMAHYLEAIENGEAEKLPTREYFMLFARGYAQYLGVDPSVLEGVEGAPLPDKNGSAPVEAPVPDDIEAESDEPEVQAKRFGRTLLYIIVGIVVVFAAFFVYIEWFSGVAEETLEPGYSETGEANPDTSGNPAAAAPLITIPDEPYQPPKKLALRMVAKQNVWAVVIRDGDTVLNRRLEAGQERRWEADYRYRLTLGVSNAVELYIDGEKLAPLSERARTISGLEIDQANYKQFYKPQFDTTAATPPPAVQTSQPKTQTTGDDSWIEQRPSADTTPQTPPAQQSDQTEVPPAADSGGADGN